jgi:acetyl-CoA C-acetyltransferase/acetyl-CoA acyltransferase
MDARLEKDHGVDVYLAPGVRTPFMKSRGDFAHYSSIELSTPVLQAMIRKARPDLLLWGQVIPDPTISNLARDALFAADLDGSIPAYSSVMACASSFVMAIQASGMLGRGGNHLVLVGGVESMSHVAFSVKYRVTERLLGEFAADPAKGYDSFSRLTREDFDLPTRGWSSRAPGQSMGDFMEITAQEMGISREEQDQVALLSHRRAVAGQDSGFFNDLILPFGGVERDSLPRRDTTMEKLGKLSPVFDRSGKGTLTAGNASPLTDGAGGLWVGDQEGFRRLSVEPTVRLVDWEMAAVDYRKEGMLMAPARTIPRLLARHRLRADEIVLWELHEAFAAQVIANIRAVMDPKYRRERAGVDFDLGEFSWDRVNPHGGSIAIGHPFGATGARILSQAVTELSVHPKGSYGMVSVCAAGGQGAAALLERV